MKSSKENLSFLEIIQKEGISLKSEGVSDIALTPEAAIRAIGALRESKIGILGGEIWRICDGRAIPTYDIWNTEISECSSYEDFLSQSWDVSERQIAPHLNSEDKFLVVLGI